LIRAGRTSAWLAALPAWAASHEGPKAVFVSDKDTEVKVRAMNLPNVVVNPKPEKKRTLTFYDECMAYSDLPVPAVSGEKE